MILLTTLSQCEIGIFYIVFIMICIFFYIIKLWIFSLDNNIKKNNSIQNSGLTLQKGWKNYSLLKENFTITFFNLNNENNNFLNSFFQTFFQILIFFFFTTKIFFNNFDCSTLENLVFIILFIKNIIQIVLLLNFYQNTISNINQYDKLSFLLFYYFDLRVSRNNTVGDMVLQTIINRDDLNANDLQIISDGIKQRIEDLKPPVSRELPPYILPPHTTIYKSLPAPVLDSIPGSDHKMTGDSSTMASGVKKDSISVQELISNSYDAKASGVKKDSIPGYDHKMTGDSSTMASGVKKDSISGSDHKMTGDSSTMTWGDISYDSSTTASGVKKDPTFK